MYTTLIEPEELAAPLSRNAAADSDWVVLDCRFDLPRPDWGASAYAAGHVPNALYAHLDHDLSGPVTPTSGRHPLPSVERLAETFGRWGIDDDVQVIAYDQGNGAFAARLWWLLRWVGHQKVAVLNGGFAAWLQAGLPTDTTPGARKTADVRAATWRANRRDHGRARACGVGRRAGERRLAVGGRARRGPIRGGRMKRSTQWPVTFPVRAITRSCAMSTPEESFCRRGELRERWTATLSGATAGGGTLGGAVSDRATAGGGASSSGTSGGARSDGGVTLGGGASGGARSDADTTLGAGTNGATDAARAIAMCGSGVTACHNLLALEVAGLPGARLYAGSWSEWIRDSARPVARGAAS